MLAPHQCHLGESLWCSTSNIQVTERSLVLPLRSVFSRLLLCSAAQRRVDGMDGLVGWQVIQFLGSRDHPHNTFPKFLVVGTLPGNPPFTSLHCKGLSMSHDLKVRPVAWTRVSVPRWAHCGRVHQRTFRELVQTRGCRKTIRNRTLSQILVGALSSCDLYMGRLQNGVYPSLHMSFLHVP